jgi:hypothetical protein
MMDLRVVSGRVAAEPDLDRGADQGFPAGGGGCGRGGGGSAGAVARAAAARYT